MLFLIAGNYCPSMYFFRNFVVLFGYVILCGYFFYQDFFCSQYHVNTYCRVSVKKTDISRLLRITSTSACRKLLNVSPFPILSFASILLIVFSSFIIKPYSSRAWSIEFCFLKISLLRMHFFKTLRMSLKCISRYMLQSAHLNNFVC